MLCLWRKVVLKGCVKPASINPPTAPKQLLSIPVTETTAAEYWAEETGAAPHPETHNYYLSHTHTKADIHAYTYTHAINCTNWNSAHLREDFSSQNTNSIRRATTHSLSAGKMDHLWALQATSQWHCLGLILTAVVNCIWNLCSASLAFGVWKAFFVLAVLQTSACGHEKKKSHFNRTKPHAFLSCCILLTTVIFEQIYGGGKNT